MSGGLRIGLSEENAARFAFLMATPIIGAAAILKVPHALKAGSALGPMLLGALAAALAAYFSVNYLVRYFQTRSLKPFAMYCVTAGTLLSIFFAIKHS